MNVATRRAVTSAADAVRELCARDPRLPELRGVLDDERRAELLGRETRVMRVRYKPGASAVAALRDDEGAVGWIVTYADPVKLRKSVLRAQRLGVTPCARGPLLAGPVRADRVLSRTVRALFGPDGSFDDTVLRYNPLRRLVLRVDGHVVKLTATAPRNDIEPALAAHGVPVLVADQPHSHARRFPWWGDGDLAARSGRAGDVAALTAAAGGALALMHSVPVRLPGLATLDAGAEAHRAAHAVAALLPWLAPRAHRLAASLQGLGSDEPHVLCHGDWTADQVLSDGSGIRLIDLDRVVRAPAGLDLGSYLDAGGDVALRDGYRRQGGVVDESALAGWRALAGLRRAVEPFRTGSPTWPAEIEERLARAERTAEDGR